MAFYVIFSIREAVHIRPYPVGATPPELLVAYVADRDIAIEKRVDLVTSRQLWGLLVELEPVSFTFFVLPHIPGM